MARSTTPSFVVEFKLNTTKEQEHILLKRMNMAKQIYNDFNKKLHKIYHYITHCEGYTSLVGDENQKLQYKQKAFIKNYHWEVNRKRGEGMKDLIIFQKDGNGFTDYISRHYNLYDDLGINSKILENIAKNLFCAWKKKINNPKIKCKLKGKDDLMSLKTTNSKGYLIGFDINIDKQEVVYNYEKNKSMTIGFENYSNDGRFTEYEMHAFYVNANTKRKIKNLSIVPKIIRGKIRFYLQLTFEGIAYGKNRHLGQGEVGIDIGTQTVAVVGDNKLSQHILADKAKLDEKKLARIERKMDRSRRATNPNNFNENGTAKRNTKKRKLEWNKSKNYIKLQNQRRELYRKKTDLIKRCHIELANQLLEYGNVFKVENNDYHAMAKRAKETKVDEKGKFKCKKRFGKSIAKRAPSSFINILGNKVKSLGGELKIVNRETACTQFDFTDMEKPFKKHDLKEREVVLSNGDKHGRDLISAFNIKHVIRGFKEEKDKEKKKKIEKTVDNFNIQQMLNNYTRFCEMEREEYISYERVEKQFHKNFGKI